MMKLRESRNADLIEAYEKSLRALGKRARTMKRSEIFAELSQQPARQFYVSEREAKENVSLIHKGREPLVKSPERRAMYYEIARRSEQEYSLHPERRFLDIVAETIYTPAPSFYIKPSSIEVIYNKIMRERYKRDREIRLLRNKISA